MSYEAPLNLNAPPAVPAAMQIPPEVAQMIASQRDENARLRAAQTESQIGQALGAAITENSDRLLPGAAGHLTTLLRGQLKLVESGGESVIAGPKLESVGQFVKDALQRPEFSMFVRASTQGGTVTGQTIQSAHTPPAYAAPAQQPRNFDEAVMLATQQRMAAGPIHPDGTKVQFPAFGLRRTH